MKTAMTTLTKALMSAALLLTLSLSATAHATSYPPSEHGTWKHQQFAMGSQVQIRFDYSLGCDQYSLGLWCNANPFWVNLYGAHHGSQVRVIFVRDGQTETLDLIYDYTENKFTGNLPYGISFRPDIHHDFQFAVVIDGVWSTSFNGGRNYEFKL